MAIILENIELVLVSFGASFGLAFVFHIPKNDLLIAGTGGALTRCVYLVLLALSDHTFVQSLIAAMFAALFAEIMAMRRRSPSTIFLYPAILPLIPGGTLYHIALNLILGDQKTTLVYTWDCLLALSGICLGFVVVSTFTYYRRIYYVGEHIEWKLRTWLSSLRRKR